MMDMQLGLFWKLQDNWYIWTYFHKIFDLPLKLNLRYVAVSHWRNWCGAEGDFFYVLLFNCCWCLYFMNLLVILAGIYFAGFGLTFIH